MIYSWASHDNNYSLQLLLLLLLILHTTTAAATAAATATAITTGSKHNVGDMKSYRSSNSSDSSSSSSSSSGSGNERPNGVTTATVTAEQGSWHDAPGIHPRLHEMLFQLPSSLLHKVVSKSFDTFILDTLKIDPTKRITSKDALKSKFLADE